MQVPLEVANLRASRDVAVLDFSYTFGTAMVILLCSNLFSQSSHVSIFFLTW